LRNFGITLHDTLGFGISGGELIECAYGTFF
jgi:hypothetical protein